MKTSTVGLFYGRFQPPHNGHHAIVQQMKQECDQSIILVGFGQDGRTEKNPLIAAEIIGLWKKIEPDGLFLGFMNELETTSKKWAEWIFWHCKLFCGNYPTSIYGGPDCWGVSRGTDIWSDISKDHPLKIVCVDARHSEISATKVRKSIVDDTDYWSSVTSPSIHQDLSAMRNIFIRCQGVEQKFKVIPDPEVELL